MDIMPQIRQQKRRADKKMNRIKPSLPLSQGYNYTFFGKVLPERANVSISPLNLNIDYPDSGIQGSIKLSIQLSQIFAQFTSIKKIENVSTLRNYIERSIRIPVDSLGYFLGCGYDIEITSMLDFSGNQTVFGVGIGNIDEFKKKRPKEFPELLNLNSGKNGKYLQSCFGDLREAIRNTKDAGFFCYRAIESLTLYFADNDNLQKEKKKEIWELFRENLDINRDQIDFIQKFSNPVRHGDTIYIPPEDMKKIFDYTWEIVDKYIIFASNGYRKSS